MDVLQVCATFFNVYDYYNQRVYDLKDHDPADFDKACARVREWEWNYPRTMYGCNKLYCEQLGIYFSKHYRQLAADRRRNAVAHRQHAERGDD